MTCDLDLPGGAPAPEASRLAASVALDAHLGPPPPYGHHAAVLGDGVANGQGEWIFRVAYRVDPDHFSQYDQSTSYEGLAIFREGPTGTLEVVGGTLVVQDNGTNSFDRPGTRVSLLDLGGS